MKSEHEKLERDIEKPTVEWADSKGIDSIKLNIFGRCGWPDREFFIPGGRPLLIEFKRPGKKPRKLQRYIISKLKGLGYDVASTDNFEEATEYITAAVQAAKDKEFYARTIAKQFEVPIRLLYERFNSITTRLGAASVPKISIRIPAEAQIRRSVSRPRSRQNKHRSKGVRYSAKK